MGKLDKNDPRYQNSREVVLDVLSDIFGGEESEKLIEPVLEKISAKRKKEKKPGFIWDD